MSTHAHVREHTRTFMHAHAHSVFLKSITAIFGICTPGEIVCKFSCWVQG